MKALVSCHQGREVLGMGDIRFSFGKSALPMPGDHEGTGGAAIWCTTMLNI